MKEKIKFMIFMISLSCAFFSLIMTIWFFLGKYDIISNEAIPVTATQNFIIALIGFFFLISLKEEVTH